MCLARLGRFTPAGNEHGIGWHKFDFEQRRLNLPNSGFRTPRFNTQGRTNKVSHKMSRGFLNPTFFPPTLPCLLL